MLTSNGLVSQVAVITDRQQGIIQTLEKIDNSLQEVKKNNDNLLVSISGLRGEVNGKEKAETAMWQKSFWIIMAVIGLSGIVLSAYLGFKNNAQSNMINTRVEDLGTPVITNKRGAIINLPEGAKIRMFKVNDTIKKDTIK